MKESEFQRLIELSHERRGDKASKYPILEPAFPDIQKLLNADVALTVIRDWLEEKQNIKVVLNTLRKFVVLHIGRETYDLYLRRNGWAKNIHEKRTSQLKLGHSVKVASASPNVGDARNVMSGLGNPKTPGNYDPNADISHFIEIDQDAEQC
jgi:hypothetical protein